MFFGEILFQNNLKPNESILIDNSEHVSIAKDFGMDCVKIENNNLSNRLDLMIKDM